MRAPVRRTDAAALYQNAIDLVIEACAVQHLEDVPKITKSQNHSLRRGTRTQDVGHSGADACVPHRNAFRSLVCPFVGSADAIGLPYRLCTDRAGDVRWCQLGVPWGAAQECNSGCGAQTHRAPYSGKSVASSHSPSIT